MDNKIKEIKFGEHRIQLVLDRYNYYNNLYIGLICEEGPFCDLTTNIEALPEGFAAVDVNNFSEAREFIEKNNLGQNTSKVIHSGYCTYPIYKFDIHECKKYEWIDES